MEKQAGFYANFGLDDFLNDDNFKNWAKYPDAASDLYWNGVISSLPEKEKLISQAKDIIFLLSKPVIARHEDSRERIWKNIETGLELKYNYPFRRLVGIWTKVAASILLFLSIGYSGYYLYQNSKKVYVAEYGKLRRLHLPDGSSVVLNSNSEISYPRKWQSGKSRELWMKGEALFDVKHVALALHKSIADTFRVHTGNLTITVLGTQFNIKNRRNLTSITLKRGRIRIDFNDPGIQPVFLKPGDHVNYNQISHEMSREKADPVNVIAWSERRMVLQGDNLSDVIHVLEDNYGYQVILKDPQLGTHKMEGTIPLHSADDILFVIRKVFNVSVEQKGNTLTIY